MKLTLDHKPRLRRHTDPDDAVDIVMLGLSTLILLIVLFFVVVDAAGFYVSSSQAPAWE